MHTGHSVSHVVYLTTNQDGGDSLYQITEEGSFDQNSTHPEDAENEIHSRQVPSCLVRFGERLKNVCTNNLTCICLILIPVTIAGMLICVFVMQDSSINAKDNLHTRVIYAFIIFSVTFLSPFALFFLIVVVNKLYYNYLNRRLNHEHDHHGQDGSYTEEYNHNNNEIMGLAQERVISGLRSQNRSRPRLRRQDAIDDCPPEYEDLMSASMTLSLLKDDPPSYEMALLYPAVKRPTEKSPDKTVSPDGNTPPPPYDEKTMT